MIIGTAGHIDHGKTTLVKALTGMAGHRLKEEQARGITIELGFASLALPGGPVLGFVDVPGHEKLVRTMLAGAAGISHVLLAVAADDGPMPQTHEHLAILGLLGLQRGVVALTKCDLVSPQRLAAARAETLAMLAHSSLAGAPVLPVSAATGQGLDALRAHLQQALPARPAEPAPAHFRLAVDRVFTLAGIGTVATGTAVAGRVAVGDRLLLSPSGRPVRVRSLQVHGQPATEGVAGQRLALALAGVQRHEARRGDWLLAEPLHAPTQRLEVRLQLLPGQARPLAHGAPVHLHLGTDDVAARVLLLDAGAVAPGGQALARLPLARPIGALGGDRFVLRDPAAGNTLGGGVVIDPFAPEPRRGHRAQHLAALGALAQPEPAQALAALLALGQPAGVDAGQFALRCNLPPAEWQALRQAVPHVAVAAGAGERLFAPAAWQAWGTAVQACLQAHHRAQPDSPGLTLEQLQGAVPARPAAAVFAPLLQALVQAGGVQRSGPYLALAGHRVALPAADQALWQRVKPWLDEAGPHPPRLAELLLRDHQLHEEPLRRVLQRLHQLGQLHAVGADYFVQTPHLLALAEQGWALAQADPQQRLNLKALREATGISRHFSVPLVEYFDQIGLTRRDAVGRHFRRPPSLVLGG